MSTNNSEIITQNIPQSKPVPAWEIVSVILKSCENIAKPGVPLYEFDKLAEAIIKLYSAESLNKGYKPKWAPTPFPYYLCVSINNEIAHGFADDRVLKDGDLVSFDIGVRKDGLAADGALTVGVGNVSSRDKRLLRYAKQALDRGIGVVRAGVKLEEIARAIEPYAMIQGFVVNSTFAGHFIGKEMHEDPPISHVIINHPDNEVILQPGWKLCLEPMLTYKDRVGRLLPNGWTVVTQDGQKSAFFEQMVEITKTGCKILTTHLND